jgi:hypothetical protein
MIDDLFSVALQFARALDSDDFATLSKLLAPDCMYATRTGTASGREAICESYLEASTWARLNLDEVAYSSEVLRSSDITFVVRFVDRIRHRKLRHVYQCEQLISVSPKGWITTIKHVELAGEREALISFLRDLGLDRTAGQRPIV